jgi:dedicator of cytokinesis protein 1
MIAKLDILVEGGRGDEHYKELFGEIMLDRCENHSTMRDQVRCVGPRSRHQ